MRDQEAPRGRKQKPDASWAEEKGGLPAKPWPQRKHNPRQDCGQARGQAAGDGQEIAWLLFPSLPGPLLAKPSPKQEVGSPGDAVSTPGLGQLSQHRRQTNSPTRFTWDPPMTVRPYICGFMATSVPTCGRTVTDREGNSRLPVSEMVRLTRKVVIQAERR